jgi:broad specificity phosphatase PhoE
VIVLVRHGETDDNRAGLLLGRADPPLNATGRAQAAAIATGLAGGEQPVAVVSSPLRRTVETAEAIAATWGAPVERDERLVEIDYGEWDRRAVADVALDDWRAWRADPGFTPPGGESLAEVQARSEECAAALLARAGDGVIVAVSHVSPIKAAVAWALGGNSATIWRLRLDIASTCRIVAGPDGPVLLTFNERSP